MILELSTEKGTRARQHDAIQAIRSHGKNQNVYQKTRKFGRRA